MKRKFDHPAPSASGPKYWRSLDELAATPGFKAAVEREFPEGASTLDGVDRRQFMKIMAASFALGGVGLAGCRRPEANILPFGKSVEGVIPGLPQYYATSMPLRGSAIPLIAETHQGRPTKLEGNPSYLPHGGASSLLAQASILDLYDPDRATSHSKGGHSLDDAAVKALLDGIAKAYAASQGEGLAFLAGSSSSPTRARLVALLQSKLPKATWAEYDPLVDSAPLAAAKAAFGRSVKPVYRFSKAKRILSIDSDFFHAESGSLYYARDFSKGRKVEKKGDSMNRLYVAESGLSLTGSMADHRLRLATSNMLALAAAIAAKVTGDASYQSAAAGLSVKPEWIAECAADLLSAKGESVVVAGSHLPVAVHAVVYAINAALGAIGATVDFVDVAESSAASIQALASSIKSGSVKTLVILGGNPAYDAPADLEWSSLQKSVPEVVRYGYSFDETSSVAGIHIAAAHYLESWGDARTVDGTIVPIQPMILPLFGGLTENEVISRLLGDEKSDPYELVFQTITAGEGAGAEKAFRRFLHDGLIAGSAYPVASVTLDSSGVAQTLATAGAVQSFTSASQLEVRFIADHKMDDGRFLNNGWLQECPDPISKITWDNAILVSPKLAKDLGIDPAASLLQVARKEDANYDRGREKVSIAEVTVNGRKVKGPVHIQPGLNNYTIFLIVGYGRSVVGHVGKESGYNAYSVRTTGGFHVATGSIAITPETYYLANTQEHWSMEGRDLIREANLDEYTKNPAFVKSVGLESHSPSIYGEEAEGMTPGARESEIPRGGSLYETPKFTGIQQWGMSIDLNTCIGCNACVVACQAENNVPIVGKEQVLRGREMHWLRIDRYYSDGEADAAAFGGKGNRELPEEPQISLQPIACQHCELAPCETVCPVNATVHDDEGLNVMAYNRCIGTRYCANNCPYKVRRFNFFDWNQRQLDSLYMGPLGPQGMPELVKMAKNPQVTVRMRGVMEKCTYCVQRIENGKIAHKVKVAQAGNPADIVVPDGEIKSACQQVCPVDAIVFGNIMDPESAVSKAKAREQDYQLLGYLNIRPRTTFSGKLRNPNPRMPDYKPLPLSRVEHENKNYPPGFEKHEGEGKAGGAHEASIVSNRTGGLS